jgi:proline iminopeptidase
MCAHQLLVQGRLDLGGPLQNAWDLARAWPGAELVVIEDSGHTGSPSFNDALQAAFDRFGRAADDRRAG